VLILSSGYLASSWCLLEMSTFLTNVSSGSGRIFIVEHDFIPREERPSEFRELLGHPFWSRDSDTGQPRTLGIPKPNPEREPEYYQRLNALARQLAQKLHQLREEALAVQNQDDSSNLSRLATLKKSRLENEKASIEAEINGKLKEHESFSISLGNPRVPEHTRQRLTEKLDQLETEVQELEIKLEQINHELKILV